jgi:hypothetical protein
VKFKATQNRFMGESFGGKGQHKDGSGGNEGQLVPWVRFSGWLVGRMLSIFHLIL